MYKAILMQAGLTEDEAKVYEALIDGGPQTAGALLVIVKPIKRGTLYQILHRLTERGLVREAQKEGKALFLPQPPDVLVGIMEKAEKEMLRNKDAIDKALPELKAKFLISNEQPTIQFFEGIDGLRHVYDDHLTAEGKMYLVFGRAEDPKHVGKWWGHYLSRRAKKGIITHALTPDGADASHDEKFDKKNRVIRTWIAKGDYSAPVEIDVYGNKVAIIAYGKEIFCLMIEHAPIAKALKDLFVLAERGAKTVKVDHDHP